MNRLTLLLTLLAPLGVARAQSPLPVPPGLRVSAAEMRASLPVAAALPDFELQTLSDSTFRFSEQHGRVLVLNMWATWCGPCRAEMPELDSLAQRYGPNGLSVVGISVDEDEPSARSFATRIGVSYPLAMDDGKMVERLGASGVLPITYVFDRAGHLRLIAEGRVTAADLYPTLWALLDEAP